MELNSKIASLEDEVKILKGEVKLILSEIRTAILGQDNPFAEPGQALRADPGALESRPPIRVVHVPSEDDDSQELEQSPPLAPESVWDDEEKASLGESEPVEEPQETAAEEPAPPPPVAKRKAAPKAIESPPVAQEEPAASAAPALVSPPPPVMPTPGPIPAFVRPDKPQWSLITVAGLAVWAEEAMKQVGSKRLRILLDLCEFTGYLSGPAKEALLKITSLGEREERKAAPSANECLVVLCQLDALMRGDEPAGQSIRGLARWQQPA
jgi:hypothetical protein